MPDQATARDAVANVLDAALEPLMLALLEHGVMLGARPDVERDILAALGIDGDTPANDVSAAIVLLNAVHAGHLRIVGDASTPAVRAAIEHNAPPPAPASDDVKARATAVLRGEDARWRPGVNKYPDRIVDALTAAGLLAAPSHLDRLAAWAAAEPMERSFTVDATGTGAFIATVGLWSEEGRVVEIDTDAQEAARRVLARLEES